MSNAIYDDVTEVTYASEKPTWNYTRAVEPVSKKSPSPRPSMMTPAAKTRYAVLIGIMIVGAILVVSPDTIPKVIGALGFGWAGGQFLCWPAPH